MIPQILTVFTDALTNPLAIGLSLLGVVIGIVLGALPGISSTMALAILLPVSFSMTTTNAMMFLLGVFVASVYGGSISAILMNIPGTPGAIVTQLDGYPLARRGRAGEALTYAILASAFGGVLGWALLVTLAPIIARLAFHLQSPEYAAITVFGLAMLAYASAGSTFKALLSGTLGLLLATVGFDLVTNISRFDFGSEELKSGISIVPLAVGVFGLAEVLKSVEGKGGRYEVISRIGRVFPPWRELRRLWPTAVRGSLAGVLVGAIPAAGSAIGVVIAYAQEKRWSKTPERFGTGIPEGVVAPESSNNACVGGALIPMMTLGIPGDAMTAVLIGALLIHGLRPGPALFQDRLDFVAVVYASFFAAIVFTTLVGLAGVRYFARVLDAPRNVLMTGVAILCVVGSYAVRNSSFDVLVMVTFGVAGYGLQKIGIPVAPLVFGLVLGPLLEENIRRALIVHGSWSIFVRRPLSLFMLLVAAASLLYPLLSTRRRRFDDRGS